MAMKVKHAINLHKGLTAPVIVGRMLAYQNFTPGAWVYLSLHDTYRFLWLLKDRLYPDHQWEQEMSLSGGIGVLMLLILLGRTLSAETTASIEKP